MRRLKMTIATALALFAIAPQAHAAFGLDDLEVSFTGPGGEPSMQAGSHPYAMTTAFDLNTALEEGKAFADGALRDLVVDLPPGFAGKPTATPRCSTLDFLTKLNGLLEPPECADSTTVGTVKITFAEGQTPEQLEENKLLAQPTSVYNLVPPPGAAAKLGFWAGQVPVTILLGVNPDPPYNVIATLRNTSQLLEVAWSSFEIWGNPADEAHDEERGDCLKITSSEGGSATCPANVPVEPFITMPRSCTGPLQTHFKATSWWDGDPLFPNIPGASFEGTATTPPGATGCAKLGFAPQITAQPTTLAAQSPSGLDFTLNVNDEGLTNPSGIAHADIKKVEVTLPEGMTTNPAIAEGLEVCSETDLARETAFSEAGAGCPNASKVGTVEVETPLLDEQVHGSLFIAKPYENPFGSLLALYLVLQDKELGISVKQPMEVKPNLSTGQLTTVAEDLPQLPFSSFKLHFREGTRSPLATPAACGTHTVKAVLTPTSGGAPVTSNSSFQIITGPDNGPCPTGGLPPFKPGLMAGTINNAAGKHSPFNLRLHRQDDEQEFTRFSIKLPPGLTGKLAGIPYCPDAAIEAAKSKTGTEEEQNPSCPASSLVGRTLVGAGVGPSPAYAPGKVYLAGPYNGSALSIAAITAAKVGPFDIGTVVVRQGFKIDRETAEVFVDSVGSDPIPHIIDGIVVHAKDIRAYVDRPDFVLNPTSCERTSTASTLLGSGLDFASEADNNPVVVSTPFQAADCAALSFNPKLDLRLIGGTKRGAHPAFRGTLRMKRGEANVSYARVTLPRSAFLDQSHIRTVCTRVQYAQDSCPPGSIYGYAKATTPLLDGFVEGPVYLRSSEHQLPDLVAALRNGEIRFDLVGRVDSLKGRIRNTFETAPDAPVDKVVLTMQGGSKGLIINSTDLCKTTSKAIAELKAHNGRVKSFRPVVKPTKCKGKGRKGSKR